MAVIWLLLGLVLVVGVGALAVYSDSDLVPARIASDATTIFNQLTKTDPRGNTVTFLVPDYPINPEQDKTIITNQNSTEEIITQPVTDRQICYKTDKNGCIIQGFTKLKHPVSEQDILPYVYNFVISVECRESIDDLDFCSTEFVSNRGLTYDGGFNDDNTPLGGKFYFKWRPHISTSVAIYDVKIFVTSGVLDDVFPNQSIDFNSSYELDLRA